MGVPRYLHTDQGRNFESNLVKELCRLLGITKTRTTPYHPQSDGMVERFNRTLLNMLSISAQENETDWDLHLPAVMLAYRTSVHATTGETPFMLMFGREVSLPIDIMYGTPTSKLPPSSSQYAQTLCNRLETAYYQARTHTKLMQRQQKEVYDQRLEGSPYQVGDLVWLHCPAVPRGRSHKLHRPWQGPFEVIKGITNVVYRIRRCNPPHKRLVIHFNHLKPYRGKQHPDLLPTLTPASTPVHPQSSSPSGVHPQSPSPSEQALLMPETVEHSVDEHSASDDSEQAGANPGSDEHAGESDDVPAGANPGSADSKDTEHTSPPRRSTRQRRPPDRYGPYISH